MYYVNKLQRVGLVNRFRYGSVNDSGMPIPAIAFRFIGRSLLKQTDAQGYGKHTKEERRI